MSLVQAVERSQSPTSLFIAECMPQLSVRNNTIRTLYREHRPGMGPMYSSNVPANPDHNAIGGGLEYRLAWSLAPTMPEHLLRAGIATVARGNSAVRESGWRVLNELLAHGRELLGGAHVADRAQEIIRDAQTERSLGKLAIVTAWLGAAYHSSGFSISDSSPLRSPFTMQSAERLLDAVPRYALDDIQAQLELTATSHGEMGSFAQFRARTSASETTISPRITPPQSQLIADADIISSGTLIDVKSTKRATELPGEEIRQMAGYLLSDINNAHNINEIMLYRSRTGYPFRMSVDHFLAAAGATDDLPTLRQKFSQFLIKQQYMPRPKQA